MPRRLASIFEQAMQRKASPSPLSSRASQLACGKVIEGEMNSVHEVVIIAITPNGSATFTSRVQSRRDDLKVAQDVSPGTGVCTFSAPCL
jgi:hypothetical protein